MNKKSILIWLIFGLVMLVSFRISQSRSLSMHFVDEEDHIVFAEYINQGYQLHRDLQNNHQPLVYFGSGIIQKITHPDNLFMLIRRHRQVMFIYGLIWSLILIWQFKQIGLMTVLFFELLKYWLFGNLWLAESLAAYPLIYLSGQALLVWFKEKSLGKKELLFLGGCSFVIIFTLVPMWPWLAAVWLSLLIKLKKLIIYPAISLLILTLLLFLNHYSPTDWYRETIYNNFKYAIPAISPITGPFDYLKIAFFPFLAYAANGALQANFIALFFTGYLIAAIKRPKLLWLYPLLVLANNRVLSPTETYYQGFHLLPWMGLLIIIFAFSWQYINPKIKLLFCLWAAVLLFNPGMQYRLKTNPANEYYINYSRFEDANEAIKIIFKPNDRLAVLTNEPLIYWQTKTKPATRQLVYYAWEPQVKELREAYNQVFFGNNPPEFIYGNKEKELVNEKYTELKRGKEGAFLFVRNDRYGQIATEQWQKLIDRGFNR